MRKYLKFVAFGSFFATVEEFLTVVVLRGDLGGYIFTLLILFPVFLTFVYLSSRLLNRLVASEPACALIHWFAYGLLGLMIEWFLIGLAPWSDPEAHPLAMTVFQLGMFSFWATVAFAPRLFVDAGEPGRRVGRSVLKFFIPYMLVVYVLGILVPAQLKFIVIIALIIFGYLLLNLFYLKYFLQAFSRGPSAHS
jgi:hypothetical protein